MHGVALNVAPDLRHFGGIVPCGIAAEEGTVTSLASELGAGCPSLERVGEEFAEEFARAWADWNLPRGDA
jgi:lipoyl(octanoyl) transferase